MELIVRATVIYFFLWLVARGTGKRELSEMTAFELILLVTMGDLIQQGVTQEDMSDHRRHPRGGDARLLDHRVLGGVLALQGRPPHPRRASGGDPPRGRADHERPEDRADHPRRAQGGGPQPGHPRPVRGRDRRCWSRTGSSRSSCPRRSRASSTRRPRSTRPDRIAAEHDRPGRRSVHRASRQSIGTACLQPPSPRMS